MSKARNLSLLCLAVVAALSVWFASTAAVADLIATGLMTSAQAGLLTSAVQAGFVAGTLASTALGLADRFRPAYLFAAGCVMAGTATLLLPLVAPTGWTTLALRSVAGAAMAAVYPVGMKMASTWARGDLGLLVGILVGSLTLGSASPHLVNGLIGTLPWTTVYLVAGALCLAAGPLILAFREGGAPFARSVFRLSDIGEAWRSPRLRLTNLGYFGHMWELYAMWAWIGAFLQHGPLGLQGAGASILVFAVIAAGLPGAVLAGLAADRFGRCQVAAVAMVTSGLCALAIGPAAEIGATLALGIAVLWGFSAVADSAQFSALAIEAAPRHLTGTMLTIQTCVGFLITIVAIQALPWILPFTGWGRAFALLAIGPFLGTLAMLRLRRMQERTPLAA
ncbi:MFS transporter [Salinarimonas soli]|uniref:MFS transporter n=1 Tax=Salinarimonas soli TaxID=1638099 RepID=A0A5B2W0T9_9HYPH|nr:MFS transporter [Salinarimonas soli]KAA2244027.1 MFS transporter [Salinarimonas soli]